MDGNQTKRLKSNQHQVDDVAIPTPLQFTQENKFNEELIATAVMFGACWSCSLHSSLITHDATPFNAIESIGKWWERNSSSR